MSTRTWVLMLTAAVIVAVMWSFAIRSLSSPPPASDTAISSVIEKTTVNKELYKFLGGTTVESSTVVHSVHTPTKVTK